MTDEQGDLILYSAAMKETPETQKVAATAGEIFARDYDSLADGVVSAREALTLGLYPYILRQVFGDTISMLAYGCEHPTRRKRTPVDVKEMVKKWIPLIRELAVAHDIDGKVAASAGLDEQLLPVVTAPVAQIREFYKTLTKELKADPTIPWAVWKLFDFWGENVLDKISTEQELRLKTEVAKRIAENSMTVIPREDWVNSMIGALQWRSPERLKEIDEAIEAGEKPHVKGRESCLFLQVAGKEVML